MLDDLSSERRIVGAKQVKRALENDEALTVYIALDADKKVTDEIIFICEEKGIKLNYFDKMEELGKACKIDINAAVAALLNKE